MYIFTDSRASYFGSDGHAYDFTVNIPSDSLTRHGQWSIALTEITVVRGSSVMGVYYVEVDKVEPQLTPQGMCPVIRLISVEANRRGGSRSITQTYEFKNPYYVPLQKPLINAMRVTLKHIEGDRPDTLTRTLCVFHLKRISP